MRIVFYILTLMILGDDIQGTTDIDEERRMVGPPRSHRDTNNLYILSKMIDKAYADDKLSTATNLLANKDFAESDVKGLFIKISEAAKSYENVNMAKTCNELKLRQPELESGYYKIDPNGRSEKDAIEVWCDMDKKATCIEINTPTKDDEITASNDGFWLSQKKESKFTYKADYSQIGFLQKLSNQASQNVTFHCKNTAGFYDKETKSSDKGLTFLLWNDSWLSPDGFVKFRYTPLLDTCQDKSSEWGKTVIAYDTDRPRRLPFLDVLLQGVGQPNQAFKFEVGPVCYT